FDGQAIFVLHTVIVVENGAMPWKLHIQHHYLLLSCGVSIVAKTIRSARRKASRSGSVRLQA
ncbi:MAG: hypothetical protein IKP58_11805, partial [Victivallales bacterium]|nr:hypothetical protein [Victivallales bacterium]